MGQESDTDVSYEVSDTKQTVPKRPSILITLLLGVVVTYAPHPSLIVYSIPFLWFFYPICLLYLVQILLVWGLHLYLFSDKPINFRYHLIALLYIVLLYPIPLYLTDFSFTIYVYTTELAVIVGATVLLILFSSIILHRKTTLIVYGSLLFIPLFILRLFFQVDLSFSGDFAGIGLIAPAVLFLALFPPIGLGLRLIFTGIKNKNIFSKKSHVDVQDSTNIINNTAMTPLK